ncbi:hypothetical protein ABZ819_09210 [Streptomyces venezuelae]|uniref:hypothetical protein n=1 Tax=Streptomyces venezuelae TaxID=54571 RepID=UPI003441AE62
MNSTPQSTIPVRHLPIQPRPRAGEGRTAFIERLVTANFLKPSYLRAATSRTKVPKPSDVLGFLPDEALPSTEEARDVSRDTLVGTGEEQ